MTLKEKIKALVHYDLIAKLKDILLDFSGNLDNTIEEAPEDGNKYARQDGEWTEISGGGGGSQDLQSVLTQGNSTILDFYKELSYPGLASLKAGVIPLIGSGAPPFTGASVDLENGRYMKAGFLASEGVALFVETNMNDQLELTTAKSLFFKFPVDKPEANYILATLDDIPVVLPVSDSVSGIVNNTSLQELGGVDKLINGLRIGRGAGGILDNTALGYNALALNTTGTENVAIGYSALSKNTTGGYNTALGWGALALNTTGIGNVVVGDDSMKSNTTGGYNTALGAVSLQKSTTGNYNTAIGYASAYSLTTGNYNTAIGTYALQLSTVGTDNSMVGYYAGAQATGSNNTAVGNLSLSTNSATPSSNNGNLNTVLGSRAGRYITSGSGNIIVSASSSNTGGNLTAVSTGSNNIIINPNDNTTGSGVTTGSGNTLIGRVTGLTAATANTVILADGVGTQRLVSNSSNLTTLPAQTTALITGDVTGKAVLTREYLGTRIGTTAPASATDTGTVGEIRVPGDGFIYWCTATNTWIRSAGVTW